MSRTKLRVITVSIVTGLCGLVIITYSKTAAKMSPKIDQTYVALGDSIAAGVGLKTASDASACDRTNESYPNILASKLGYKLIDLACSGASTKIGILSSQEVNKANIKAQLDQLLAIPTLSIVTITIGANDVGWIDILLKCYESRCDTPADTNAFSSSLQDLKINLRLMLTRIQQNYKSSNPKVILTGINQIFPATKTECSELTNISPSEIDWVHNRIVELNATVQVASSDYAFATFLPINFAGHELCTTNSWVQNFKSLGAFHPNENGQRAIADQIFSALKN